MIDKVNNITSGSTQSKRSIDENKVNKSSGDNRVTVNKDYLLILIILKLVKN